jgi:flagellar basal-body rod protein FlgF
VKRIDGVLPVKWRKILDAMTVAAIGMQNDLLRLNSISQNLANVMTPGYKRSIPVAGSFGQYIDSATDVAGAASNPALSRFQEQTVIDPSAGTLRQTGNPLDVAIDGEGYFEVLTESGSAYTRQGTLRVDSRGRLVTSQGFPLMGVSGDMSLSGSAVTIDRNGEVRQGERMFGQLKLVRFANPEAMVALGNGLFGQGAARLADSSAGTVVHAGYQENSNVNSPREMIRLTETVRHFESMQKVIQGYDEVLEKTIRKLGEF